MFARWINSLCLETVNNCTHHGTVHTVNSGKWVTAASDHSLAMQCHIDVCGFRTNYAHNTAHCSSRLLLQQKTLCCRTCVHCGALHFMNN